MNKRQIIPVLLSLFLLALGNLFWYQFINSLQASHLLSSSALEIGFSFAVPILVLSLYLAVLVLDSIFIENRLLLFFIILFSNADYSFLLESNYLSVIGEVAISLSIYFFLQHFRQVHVVNKEKTSIVGQLSVAFSSASLVISIALAVNFYNFYVSSLSSSNVFISNAVMAKTLSPVVRIYLDDLNVKDVNEIFKAYIERRAKQLNSQPSLIRKQALERLNLPSASDSSSMKELIKNSLDKSLLIITDQYRKQIPVLVSLGLGIISQTLLSVTAFVANLLTLGFLYGFRQLKLIKYEKKEMLVDSIVTNV